MKKRINQLFIALLFFPFALFAQSESDSTGFAGDHFSLEGALEILKESKSPEDFEKKLNKEDSYVNNLDLNEDGNIDYIKVIDNMEGNVHAIVLQVDINEEESQDIAVILLEKTGSKNAILQIIGDEDVFGEEKIVEPYAESVDQGGKGMAIESFGAARIVVNVWGWPSVRYVYAPNYVVYRSPYKWQYYPNYWKPWRPHPWRWHYGKRSVYHLHFKPYHQHRVVNAHSFYKPKRKSSVRVKTKTVHTRTVVKSNKKGKGVSKKTTVKKETTVTRKSRDRKMQGNKKTTKKTKSTVTSKKGEKVKGKKTTTTKKTRKKKR